MSLKQGLTAAITTALNESLDEALEYEGIPDHQTYIDVASDAAWEYLEDKIGAVQEKLFNDLTMVRTQLDAERRRSSAISDELVRLQNELDRLNNR